MELSLKYFDLLQKGDQMDHESSLLPIVIYFRGISLNSKGNFSKDPLAGLLTDVGSMHHSMSLPKENVSRRLLSSLLPNRTLLSLPRDV